MRAPRLGFWVAACVAAGGSLALALSGLGVGWALLAMLGLAAGAGWVTHRSLRPLQERVRALREGERLPALGSGGLRDLETLGRELGTVADDLAAAQEQSRRERAEMTALLDAMAEGAIELSDDARLIRANAAARRILEIREFRPFAPVEALVRDSELRDALEAAVVRPLDPVEVTPWDRTIMVRAQPLPSGGAIVTLQDLTEVRRLERVRTDFVANASHELKTPLTALRGFAESLLDDEPPPEIRRTFIESIAKNAVRLQHLVEDLLDLSRLESGGWRAELEAVDLAELAEQVWAETLEGTERRISFSVEGAGVAWADQRAVEQIFANLFSNALRYTPDGGQVRLVIRPGPERLQVSVSDTGSGIPPESLPRIFERFYRVDPARSRAEGGTGLGLSIVAHLARAMGGSVGATSRLGDGTTVTFTLPRATEEHGAGADA
ncbi:MAG: ATP-binding protein [Gemmatimonadota bacterium]